MVLRRLAIIFLGLVVVLAGSQFLLSVTLSEVVAQGMKGLSNADSVSAKVEKSPAVAMLGGEFDKIVIKATGAKTDKIVFNDMQVMLLDAKLDMPSLLTRRTLRVEKVRDVDLSVTVTQDELARYINQAVKGVKNAAVVVETGRVRVNSIYNISGIANVAITLEGKIAGNGQQIKFVTEQFLINNLPVGNIGGTILTEIPLFDLQKLPFAVKVREVVMDQGKVTIFADNRPR